MKYSDTKEKLKHLLALKGSPWDIAVGAGIGFFWNFIPSLGVGFVLSLLVARLLKVSSVAAVTANLATGFFIPIFYTLNVITGKFVTGIGVSPQEISGGLEQSLEESVGNIEGVLSKPNSLFQLEKFQSLSVDFIVGAIINAVLFSLISAFIIWVILKKREKYLAKKGEGKEGNESIHDFNKV